MTFQAGLEAGRAWVDGLALGLVNSIELRRTMWAIQELLFRQQAARSMAHADWFCSLPWWRRLLALAFGL